MKKCEKCKNEFEPSKGLINYCSLKCRNSREWSEDDKKIKSNAAKKSEKVKNLNSKITAEVRKRITITKKIKHKEKILNEEYNKLSFGRLRLRVLFEQDEKCNNCGLGEWLNQKIVLELEHIDGDHFNNKRDNLEMLCPNCHSLTTTWRGRNKKNMRNKIDDAIFLEKLLINDWNMRQALLDLGLTPKGGNYKRCHRIKKEYFENVV